MIDAKELRRAGLPILGEYLTDRGRPLTFDEVMQRMGQYVLLDVSTESRKSYQRVFIVGVTARVDELEGRKRLYGHVAYRYNLKKNHVCYVRRYEGVGSNSIRDAVFYEEHQNRI